MHVKTHVPCGSVGFEGLQPSFPGIQISQELDYPHKRCAITSVEL
jgi:hypothetical protein